jgi:PKD repeat protein
MDFGKCLVRSSFLKKGAGFFFLVMLCLIAILVTSAAAQSTASIAVSGVVKAHPPVAAFIGDPLSGKAPLLVKFADQSKFFPTAWKWEYRSATGSWTKFSTSRNASFTFPAGSYDIRLTVTNTAGSDSATKAGYISVTTPVKKPVARFSVFPNTGKAPLWVVFRENSENNPTSYRWRFGDGTSSVLKDPPSHEYRQPGFYVVQLTVSNSAGSDTTERFVVVIPRWWWWQ